jgi:hypothetical protein
MVIIIIIIIIFPSVACVEDSSTQDMSLEDSSVRNYVIWALYHWSPPKIYALWFAILGCSWSDAVFVRRKQ